MKNSVLLLLVVSSLFSLNIFSQTSKDSGQLGLPGDNLDLYAVLDLFQKSKTIEDFEKSLNDEKSKINNLDLNNDNKVDFIKVVTNKNGDDFTFVLQDAVTKTETQDVAVILVSKDKNQKVSLQIVGDKALYGKDYIVEPKATTNTANPGYTGSESATMNIPAPSTIVVVESAPIVVYVYSPAYVPYYPPYYYGYYPPYYNPMVVPITYAVYHANHYNNYYHGGGYGNTTVIVNTNNYNYYNNSSRNTSNTVVTNNANGNYKNNGTAPKSTSANAKNSVNKSSTSTASNSTKPSASKTMSPSTGTSSSMRQATTKNYTRPSASRSSKVEGRRK